MRWRIGDGIYMYPVLAAEQCSVEELLSETATTPETIAPVVLRDQVQVLCPA